MELRLGVGDIIEVIGWVMLKGLDDGKRYKVARIEKHFMGDVYYFSKPKGKKIVIGHYCYDVDGYINNSNNNRIEIVEKSILK